MTNRSLLKTVSTSFAFVVLTFGLTIAINTFSNDQNESNTKGSNPDSKSFIEIQTNTFTSGAEIEYSSDSEAGTVTATKDGITMTFEVLPSYTFQFMKKGNFEEGWIDTDKLAMEETQKYWDANAHKLALAWDHATLLAKTPIAIFEDGPVRGEFVVAVPFFFRGYFKQNDTFGLNSKQNIFGNMFLNVISDENGIEISFENIRKNDEAEGSDQTPDLHLQPVHRSFNAGVPGWMNREQMTLCTFEMCEAISLFISGAAEEEKGSKEARRQNEIQASIQNKAESVIPLLLEQQLALVKNILSDILDEALDSEETPQVAPQLAPQAK